MKYIFSLFLIFFFSLQAYSQESISINGIVKTNDGKILANASVILYYKGSRDSIKISSNDKGAFLFPDAKPKPAALIVSYVGYKTFMNSYDFSNLKGEQLINDIVMIPGDNTLENITLESSKIQIKEDTISYKIDSTMYRKNDVVEDLLKKLPGVQVDKSGTVTAQGKEVTKVKVNGKEFFNGDVRTATRELNADMVDKIQIIDDYGDQAAFTGVKEGDPSKTLNIELKKDKNKGYFGNLTAGAGTEKRYVTSVSINRFNNDQQISLIGNLNNTNASLFNFGSIGGSMGNMISSMAKSMGIGQGGGGVAATLGNFGISDGTGTTKSIGLNYRDQWGTRLSVYGSYSYSQKAITTIKSIGQQNSFRDIKNDIVSSTNDYSVTNSHRFSFNMEYKMDSFNYFKFSPSITYRKTASNYNNNYFILNDSIKTSDGIQDEYATSKVPAFNGSLLFNHRFHKKGRTMSLNLSTGHSTTDGTDDIQNFDTYYFLGLSQGRAYQQFIPQDNHNRNYGVRVSYIEPLSKKRSLEFNYAYNYQYTGNDRQVFDVDTATGTKTFLDSASSIYNNVYVTNRAGINFRTNEKKYNYTIGFAVQPGSIKSNNTLKSENSYDQQLINYYPVIRFAYNFSRSRSFNLNYNGSTNQPGYNQLNPEVDSSNSLNHIIGNPALKPEFASTFSTRYNNFDFITGNVFFGNISVSITKDKIVTNTSPLSLFGIPGAPASGKQATRYLNSNGFYTIVGFYNISRPKQNRKYVLNWGGNVIYNNNISYIEGSKNVAGNWVVGQRISEDVKVKQWLETNATINYTFNSTKNSLTTTGLENTTVHTWTVSNSSKIYFTEDFILSYDIDKSFNSGYSDNVIDDPLIINSTLEKQFLKKKNLSVKLQALDLLNENKGISRSVSGNNITDTRVNRLGRYFLLSLVFRFNKFRGDQQQIKMGGMMVPGGGPGMRPPM